MPVVAVSMQENDFGELERLKQEGGFSNRSEVVRHALQLLLSEHRSLEETKGQITAVFTVSFADAMKDRQCNRVQHEYSHLISAMMHAHTIGGGCIEVLVIKGDADEVREFLQRLRTQKPVEQVRVELFGEEEE
ncbi:CopG family ribbon-helix-helix protein [Candidatus Thorarchaeota archaeon]|nr:MAG: CopG family ribbon-helix-helix protein [Candidatus Thorarchaeota archaeon]